MSQLLPEGDGGRRMPRRRAPWWMYLIAASLLGNSALTVYLYFWGPEPPFEQLNFERQAMVVEEVSPNSAGDRAGIQVGDRVLSIDGLRLDGLGAWDSTRINFEVGNSYQLQVERGGRQFERAMTLQRRSWSGQSQSRRFGFVLDAGTGLLSLIVALLIAFTRPFDWAARLGALSIAFLGLFSSLNGASAACRRLPIPLGALIFWPAVGIFLLPLLFFTFCSIFPRRLFRSRWALVAALAPGLLLFPYPILGFAYLTFVNPLAKFRGSGDWLPRVGASLIFAYLGAGMLALVLNYRRLEDVNQKRRVRVLVAGSLVGYIVLAPYAVAGAMRISAQSGLGRILYSWPALLLLKILYQVLPVSWAYAILRHRLFDVRVVIRRGLQYALARGLLISAVPALAGILLVDLLVHGDQPILEVLRARGWMYALLAALVAITYTQRRTWLEGLDRRFFRERYDAQRLLREVVEETRAAQSFEEQAPRVVARIDSALHPGFAALLVREPHEPAFRTLAAYPAGLGPGPLPAESKLLSLVRLLGKPLELPHTESGWLQQQLPPEETGFLRRARIDLLVPIATSADRSEALLALGAKRSEEPYSGEDKDLLVAIATSLAILLERPRGSIAPRRDVFEECPRCGSCFDTGVTQCSLDSAALVPVALPRLLEGRYRVDRRLGRGGMGTVYEATDTSLGRRVAVKVIRDDLVGSADAAERFRREARVAAAFAHPNVVTVHDFGLAADTRGFLVMELLHGATLREALRREKRLAPSRALAIMRGVCAAVEAAHRQQLLHRDLKPENVFLVRSDSQEMAKVLDFGIAKFLPSASQQTTADTITGMLMGTLKYMSPEQLRGEAPTPAWDLWALGVVTYEILTGAHPYTGGTLAELSRDAAAGQFVPLTVHLPEAPPPWQRFFERALAPEPEHRPGSALQFLAELQIALA
jgi:eukaryotic-like serine/threonine-protein kinase